MADLVAILLWNINIPFHFNIRDYYMMIRFGTSTLVSNTRWRRAYDVMDGEQFSTAWVLMDTWIWIYLWIQDL
jgi:hypothetical protein